MLIAYVAIFPHIFPNYNHAIDAAVAFFYLADYTSAYTSIPNYITHTWSLAVEEHFYMLWPLIMLRYNPTAKAIFILFVIASIHRALWIDVHEAYRKFDTRLSGLLLGCFIAKAKPSDTFPAWPGILVLILAAVEFESGQKWVQRWGFTIVEFASAIAILGYPPKWLSNSILVYIGKISYGIYLWHYPILRITLDNGYPWQVNLAFSLCLGVLFASASYHFLETPIRRWRTAKNIGRLKVSDENTAGALNRNLTANHGR
tara:strand:- start:26960 stop:27736 length:777 start_codon:yes stop_codon:yes gene_type:complete